MAHPRSGNLQIFSTALDALASTDKAVVLEAFEQLKALSKGIGLSSSQLFHDSPDLNKERIILAGGAAVLLDILQNHSDMDIRREAVRLLRSISVNEYAQQRISLDSGIETLLRLLRTTNDFSLNLGATALLWNLSVNDQSKRKIVDGGGVPLLLNLIRSGDVKLQNEAVGCLRNLSVDPVNKKNLGKQGVIPFMLRLLQSPEEKIVKNAALTLRNLISYEKNLSQIEEQNGTELLVKVLALYHLDSTKTVTNTLILKRLNFKPTLSWTDLESGINERSRIGEGKYGDVYKSKYHGFVVACKILKQAIEDDTDQILNEIRLMQALRHPNVILLMGVTISSPNQIVIVTEFAERGCLKDILYDIESLWLRLKMGEDIAKGLAWLHANRIIHRDLKFANLLVTQDYTVKISDFGLSFKYQDGIVCRGFKGNVKYSPPEILHARYCNKKNTIYPYNEKTDVYGFGLMLWELASLEQLFPDIKGKDEFTLHILAGNRPPLFPSWPQSFTDLLTMCWNTDAKKRPFFPVIVHRYDQMMLDMLCQDPHSVKVMKILWGGKISSHFKVPFNEFKKTMSSVLNAQGGAKLKGSNQKYLQAILCDPLDDQVKLEPFCKIVASFGSISPINGFCLRIKELITHSAFHGIISKTKATKMVQQYAKEVNIKKYVYLYHFTTDSAGGFELTFLDKASDVSHIKIRRIDGTLVSDSYQFNSFPELHKAFKRDYHLKRPVPGHPYKYLTINKNK